jgi:hypothetical protein
MDREKNLVSCRSCCLDYPRVVSAVRKCQRPDRAVGIELEHSREDPLGLHHFIVQISYGRKSRMRLAVRANRHPVAAETSHLSGAEHLRRAPDSFERVPQVRQHILYLHLTDARPTVDDA